MESKRASHEVREGVRTGILSSIKHDIELRGGHTARLLAAAGVIGVAGALGVTLLISTHPFGHHPPWHVAVFGAIWTGLLVVNLAIVFLRVRTPTLPLARAASVAVLGLGLAGLCGAVCPDNHFLMWWSTTSLGALLSRGGGLALSAACFGLVTTLFVGWVSAFLMLDAESRQVTTWLAALLLFILLVPGVVLQTVGEPVGALLGWLAGAAVGACCGVASGIWARARFRHSTTA